MSVRVYYWGKQKQGNYQIKIGKKRDVDWFMDYLALELIPLNDRITDSTAEPFRRYYVEKIHIDHMMNDDSIDLKEGYIWKAK